MITRTRPLELFKVYTGEIRLDHKESVKLPNSVFYYDKYGNIVEYEMRIGPNRIDIPVYKKFDIQKDDDAVALLFHVAKKRHSKFDVTKHKLILKRRSQRIYINPDGWFVRVRIGGMGGLAICRESDVAYL